MLFKGVRMRLSKGTYCYYYSETKPSQEGDYWHYAEDGVTSVIW